ncbi:hypothetical protein G9F71_023470 [Clostridium sp. FP2]|uniref:creatininase family protein n=1 Tax=Clostridium TaxID=1485 RepID=UPI0013E979DA|nr:MULTISPECIES: creatininase family protein [Clostridium]MBW9156242.1 hypothetical protein [Clostridium tagluense]MBZ9625768.1 hypothetical protein [Clostridium sp. FP2]WLC65521.1 hypothetical protein KTC93_22475 [Clostridium tagluense]
MYIIEYTSDDFKKYSEKIHTIIIPIGNRGKTIFQDALTGDATLATVEKGERIFGLLEGKIIDRVEAMQQGRYYE